MSSTLMFMTGDEIFYSGRKHTFLHGKKGKIDSAVRNQKDRYVTEFENPETHDMVYFIMHESVLSHARKGVPAKGKPLSPSVDLSHAPAKESPSDSKPEGPEVIVRRKNKK